MRRRQRTISRTWPAGSVEATRALTPRADVIEEALVSDHVFEQAHGPLHTYRRTVIPEGGVVRETITWSLSIPWFGWLFARPIGRSLARRREEGEGSPWWAPPDRLSERQARTLALLSMASMVAAFANTLFTQTANFAAERFGVDDHGQGIGGAVVRLGVLLAMPVAVLADRWGRRRTVVITAWLAPLFCALGAFVPSFWTLVASQTVARPMGIALALLAGVAAAEDMPRNSRAYAVSVLALSAGLGAGVAVGSLRLADIGDDGWRLSYLLSIIWFPVAVSLMRSLLETRRFETVHRVAQPLRRGRLFLVCAVAAAGNLFVAPASFFQNRYLDDIRGYSGGGIALFALATGTPASLGLVVGGRLADLFGRRRLILVCTPLSTAFIVLAFAVQGGAMWFMALAGGFSGAVAFPAYQVYRAELFPTGNRGRANGWISTTALLSGSVGILAVGWLRDRGWSFAGALAVMAVGQLVGATLAYARFPETAHLELEALNPEDPTISDA
ncbi:MAG: MFS transporter [Ilumatobacteraceae bacterium]